ncbi:uncharacterized protein [Nicotiana sylvestris]|uniref:uncharacterized protein n=1 Tax=Nicotiana sylvestris TaxID=4096 RepID=UPI00388C9471
MCDGRRTMGILEACHSSPYGGHHGGARTDTKVLTCELYLPTLYKDSSELVKRCDECQRAGGITKKNEMPFTTILEIDIFDVWGIDFMRPFMSSFGKMYILVAVDYVSKWVEVVALPNNEARNVVEFLKRTSLQDMRNEALFKALKMANVLDCKNANVFEL